MLTQRIPASFLLLAALVGAALAALVFARTPLIRLVTTPAGPEIAKPLAIVCSYNIVRNKGNGRVKPLLFAEPACETERFRSLKIAIDQLVTTYRSTGQLNTASVYVRDFRKGDWMSYNDAELYDPGSLLKVPTLMAWLDLVDDEHDLIGRSFTLTSNENKGARAPEFPDQDIEEGRSYTVAELLEAMIVHSDNQATGLLNRNIPAARMTGIFTALDLPEPDPRKPSHKMTSREYSVFMKALYNSTYLRPRNSEFAMELLTRTTFTEGLRSAIPAGIEVAHKFGEGGNQTEKQLHETAIVLLDDSPYLVTVMTKGPDMKELLEVLRSIGTLVHAHAGRP